MQGAHCQTLRESIALEALFPTQYHMTMGALSRALLCAFSETSLRRTPIAFLSFFLTHRAAPQAPLIILNFSRSWIYRRFAAIEPVIWVTYHSTILPASLIISLRLLKALQDHKSPMSKNVSLTPHLPPPRVWCGFCMCIEYHNLSKRSMDGSDAISSTTCAK